MRLIITSILCFVTFAVNAQLPDTLYYKDGEKFVCRVIKIDSSMVTVYTQKNDTQLNYTGTQGIIKDELDSAYFGNPFPFIPVKTRATVGNNLIASGVMTLVSSVAIIVGAQLDRFKEGAIVAGVAALISTATLINAGVVSNSKEPPPPELIHVIAF